MQKTIDELVEEMNINEKAIDLETDSLVDCYSKRGCDWCGRYYKGRCSKQKLKEWLIEHSKEKSK